MTVEPWIDKAPLWGLYLGTVIFVLVAVEGGFRIGRRRRRRPQHEQDALVGSIAAAIVGLLAFTIGFTFSMAASRYDTRKQLVLDEANALGTACLRTQLVPEPYRTAIGDRLREYVNVRVEGMRSRNYKQAIERAEALQDQLWPQVVALGTKYPHSIMAGLLVQSLNEVIDLHAKRVTAGLRNRIPGVIWISLYFVTLLAMAAIGYHVGLAGTRSLMIVLILGLAFSAILILIADLDRPQTGLIQVSYQPLIDLQEKLNAAGHKGS